MRAFPHPFGENGIIEMEENKMTTEKTYKLNDLAKEIIFINSFLEKRKSSFGFDIVVKLQKIGRMSKKYRRLCEDYCNIVNFDPIKIKNQEDKINAAIKEINIYFGRMFKVEFQQDPRGLTCTFFLDDKQIYEVLQ